MVLFCIMINLSETQIMKWNNIDQIIESLQTHHQDEDITSVHLDDLHDMIIQLDEFEDNPYLYDEHRLKRIRQKLQEIH